MKSVRLVGFIMKK